jgi:uncharacterized protein (DUF1697 family)
MGGLRLATFIALLRGINVGGTGLLPMSELVALCSSLDFQAIRTYIQSGNVIFQSTLSEDAVRSCLEKTLLCDPPPHDLMENLVTPGGEQVRPGKREIYVYYPEGMGRSKLKLPLKGAVATVRNINTVGRLIALAGN